LGAKARKHETHKSNGISKGRFDRIPSFSYVPPDLRHVDTFVHVSLLSHRQPPNFQNLNCPPSKPGTEIRQSQRHRRPVQVRAEEKERKKQLKSSWIHEWPVPEALPQAQVKQYPLPHRKNMQIFYPIELAPDGASSENAFTFCLAGGVRVRVDRRHGKQDILLPLRAVISQSGS
jgi:hypothetical protein